MIREAHIPSLLFVCAASLAIACSDPAPGADAMAADAPSTEVGPHDVGPDAVVDAGPDVTTIDVTAPDVTTTDVTTPDVTAPDAAALSGSLSLVAGHLGSPGNLDGVGPLARFTGLAHVAYDGSRYLYAAERCAVRRIDTTAPGGYDVALFSGDSSHCGVIDGPLAAARFNYIAQVVLDGTRALYLTEPAQHHVRRIDLATGAVTNYAGTVGVSGTTDGPVATARFNQPRGMALVGRALFVTDEGNVTLRRIDLDAGTVTTVAGTAGARANVDGVGAAARFTQAAWLTYDGTSRLFLAEIASNVVRRIGLPSYTVTTLAGTAGGGAFMDGIGAAARFYNPNGITMAGPNAVVVTDYQNSALRRIDVTTGAVTTLVGGPRIGDAATARVYNPSSPTLVNGVVLFPDLSGTVLRGLTLATGAVRTYAAAAAPLAEQPSLLGFATDGTRRFASRQGTLDEIDLATGAFTTLAGDPANISSVDGVGLAAPVYRASGLTYGDGALYWFEINHFVVRRMDLATRTVTTLAGLAGSAGVADGVGSAARFSPIGAIAYAGGAVYVAENNDRVIRRIDVATRTVTTVAGLRYETMSVDAVGTAARFRSPNGLVSDGGHYLYIADGTTLRRMDLRDLAVTTLAGASVDGYVDAVGVAARFNFIQGLAWEPGFVYVADGSNSQVRRFEVSTGRVTSVLGIPGRIGVRLGALPTSVARPDMLLSIGPGDLLLRDENSLLRARLR